MKGPSISTRKQGGSSTSNASTGSAENVNRIKNKKHVLNKNTTDKTTPSTPSNKKDKLSSQGLELHQMSAYAVYNNLIPGIKSYEDTSESTQASLRKKSKKRKRAEIKKKEEEAAVTEDEPKTNGKKAGGKHKLDNQGQAASEMSEIIKIKKKAADKPSKPNIEPQQTARRITPIPVPMPAANGDQETSPQKKKRRNRKKKKTVVNTEPPEKVRKIDNANLLPNPLSKQDSSLWKKKGGEMSVVKPSTGIIPMLKRSEGKMPTKKQDNVMIAKSQKSDANNSPKTTLTECTNVIETLASSEPPDLNLLFSSKVVSNSVEHGKDIFSWLIHPKTISSFMEEYWEKHALLIKRGQLFPNYFDWILSSAKLDDILRKHVLKYSKNIDVVYYENGERITLSDDMSHRCRPAALWDYYGTGNSIRVLNPQTYCGPLRKLNAALQEMFGTFVGANVYLTPPDAQGFAPHYDDIEAFVLQVEGKKQWKLYKPRNPNEVLARYSSKDFGKEEETLGVPFMDVVLEPGDLLYFPRGIIHQAHTVDGCHSMHITISCYQQNSWADLLKQHFSKAVDKLASTDIEFRKGLPLDYLSFMGLAPSKKKDAATLEKRKEFKSTLKRLVNKVGNLEANEAADEMGKKFIWDSLPPYLTNQEKDKTVVEDGEFLNDGKVKNRVEMDPDVKVKLIRKHCVRLISEESTLRLYHSVENPLVYHEDEPNFVEISEEFRSAVEFLINSYPNYVRIEDLPMADDDITKKIQITADLWERGILMTEKRLEAGELDDEEIDFDDAESFLDDESQEEGDSDIEDMIEGDDIDLEADSYDDDDDDDLDDGMEMSDLSDDEKDDCDGLLATESIEEGIASNSSDEDSIEEDSDEDQEGEEESEVDSSDDDD